MTAVPFLNCGHFIKDKQSQQFREILSDFIHFLIYQSTWVTTSQVNVHINPQC